jgi:Na+-driven multidrug efflux pump
MAIQNRVQWNCPTAINLASLSIFSMISESSFQFALLIELGLITTNLYQEEVGAYAAVSATTTFAINIFNFLLITTMAQIGKAVGEKKWHEIGKRFRVGLITAAVLGLTCGVILYILEDVLFTRVFQLEQKVEESARSIFKIRLLLIPLMMLQRVCGGLLGGFQRVKVLALRAVLIALCEVCSQVFMLNILDRGLIGSTWGSVFTAAGGVVLSLFMVVCYPPVSAVNGQVQVLNCCSKDIDERGEVVEASEPEETEEDAKTVTCDFATASANTTVRSFLLTSSVYSMSIVAANLGTAALAAHQIAMTLWMLMSLVCDGFADVGLSLERS